MKIRINSFQRLFKEFFSGFVVFLIPIVFFLKPYNLKQLATLEIFIIIESLVFILFFLILISFLINLLILKIFKIQSHSIFIICCFGFYLLFFFVPIHEILAKTIFQNGYAGFFTLFLLFLIWLSTFFLILYSKKFNIFFTRSLIVFASINIIISISSYPKYLNDIWNSKTDNNKIKISQNTIKSEEINAAITKNKKNYQNIYYIIMDEMMSLESSAKVNIINETQKIQMKNDLQQLGYKYIDQSYSSYNSSHLTLASIMEIDYPATELTPTYNNIKNFFPLMMYQNEKSILLPEIINKLGSKFIWVGNNNRPCLEWGNNPWNCTYNNNTKKLKLFIRTIYHNTPLEMFIYNFFSANTTTELLLSEDLTLSSYPRYAKNSKLNENSKFVFIDRLFPHAPYNVTKECNPRINEKNINQEFGFKSNYQCALRKILDFTKYISKEDPRAIVVFQGDHGHIDLLKKNSISDSILYRASIFNAIKAPEKCFKKFGKPNSTVNTIRFVLNCAYGFEFPFRQVIHYGEFPRDSAFGIKRLLKFK